MCTPYIESQSRCHGNVPSNLEIGSSSDSFTPKNPHLESNSVSLDVRRAHPSDAVTMAAATATWTAERRAYRALLRRNREAFWVDKVDSERSSPRQPWRSIDDLMGRGRVPTPSAVDAMAFHQHFDATVAEVRAVTADAPPPSFTPSPPRCLLAEFRLLTVADLTAAVHALPDNNNNTTNTNDNVYGAVIMARPLREFTRFV